MLRLKKNTFLVLVFAIKDMGIDKWEDISSKALGSHEKSTFEDLKLLKCLTICLL